MLARTALAVSGLAVLACGGLPTTPAPAPAPAPAPVADPPVTLWSLTPEGDDCAWREERVPGTGPVTLVRLPGACPRDPAFVAGVAAAAVHDGARSWVWRGEAEAVALPDAPAPIGALGFDGDDVLACADLRDLETGDDHGRFEVELDGERVEARTDSELARLVRVWALEDGAWVTRVTTILGLDTDDRGPSCVGAEGFPVAETRRPIDRRVLTGDAARAEGALGDLGDDDGRWVLCAGGRAAYAGAGTGGMTPHFPLAWRPGSAGWAMVPGVGPTADGAGYTVLADVLLVTDAGRASRLLAFADGAERWTGRNAVVADGLPVPTDASEGKSKKAGKGKGKAGRRGADGDG